MLWGMNISAVMSEALSSLIAMGVGALLTKLFKFLIGKRRKSELTDKESIKEHRSRGHEQQNVSSIKGNGNNVNQNNIHIDNSRSSTTTMINGGDNRQSSTDDILGVFFAGALVAITIIVIFVPWMQQICKIIQYSVAVLIGTCVVFQASEETISQTKRAQRVILGSAVISWLAALGASLVVDRFNYKGVSIDSVSDRIRSAPAGNGDSIISRFVSHVAASFERLSLQDLWVSGVALFCVLFSAMSAIMLFYCVILWLGKIVEQHRSDSSVGAASGWWAGNLARLERGGVLVLPLLSCLLDLIVMTGWINVLLVFQGS